MQVGTDVYIKYKGENAVRLQVEVVDMGFAWLNDNSPLMFVDDLEPLKPTDRLVSEIPEIARMTGCYVALADNRAIIISEFKLSRNGYNLWCSNNFIIGTITCPNCEDFTRQWGPDGLIVGAE